ncbi:MAG: hypothetical protein ABI177_01405, partial [Edaphobacter sp.]
MAKRSEVAGWIGLNIAGNGEIDRVSSIEAATASSVVFAMDSAALQSAVESQAGVILVAKSSQ